MRRLCRAGSTTAPAQTAIDGAFSLTDLMADNACVDNARAVNLRRELLAAGAPGLQFFTQNRWKATSEVLDAIGWGDRVS